MQIYQKIQTYANFKVKKYKKVLKKYKKQGVNTFFGANSYIIPLFIEIFDNFGVIFYNAWWVKNHFLFFSHLTPSVPILYSNGLRMQRKRPCSTSSPPNSALKSRTP